MNNSQLRQLYRVLYRCVQASTSMCYFPNVAKFQVNNLVSLIFSLEIILIILKVVLTWESVNSTGYSPQLHFKEFCRDSLYLQQLVK